MSITMSPSDCSIRCGNRVVLPAPGAGKDEEQATRDCRHQTVLRTRVAYIAASASQAIKAD